MKPRGINWNKRKEKPLSTLTVSDKTRQRLFALYQQAEGAKATLDAASKGAQAVADLFNQAYAMALEQYDLVPNETTKIDLTTGIITTTEATPTPDNVTSITEVAG